MYRGTYSRKNSKNMGASMKLIAIKTKDKVYISENTERKHYYGHSQIQYFLFDGVMPKTTYTTDWYELSKWPEKVEKKQPGLRTNHRWELKSGFPVSELTPAVLKEDPTDEDGEYYDVSGLYTHKYDVQEDILVPLEIEWDIIADIPQYEIRNWKYKATTSYLVDKITTPAILLSEVPCQLGGRELYTVIREYVKRHINGEYARISSDYDFSFTVMKSLRYKEPIPYTTTTGSGKREKKVTNYRTKADVQVFNMGDSSKGYGAWPETIKASTYKELEEKVDNYLKELLEKINKPLVECPYCQGCGAILDNKQSAV